jgi:hypothetical protein
MSNKIIDLFVVTILILFISCSKDDSVVVTQNGNSTISGNLKFLDESPASNAIIELRSNSSGRFVYDTCDVNGKFFFNSLYKDIYTLTFRSTSYDINTTYVTVNVDENQDVVQNVYVKFNMLDDFATKIISDSIFFIKMSPDGARLGNNFNLINNLSGYYRTNGSDLISLGSDIYLVPENINWNNPGIELSPNYISSNFQLLFSVAEEPILNGRHEIRFTDSTIIQQIFSNPTNGFAFVLKDTSANVLKIPCVDFNNNDFGLKIFYK